PMDPVPRTVICPPPGSSTTAWPPAVEITSATCSGYVGSSRRNCTYRLVAMGRHRDGLPELGPLVLDAHAAHQPEPDGCALGVAHRRARADDSGRREHWHAQLHERLAPCVRQDCPPSLASGIDVRYQRVGHHWGDDITRSAATGHLPQHARSLTGNENAV